MKLFFLIIFMNVCVFIGSSTVKSQTKYLHSDSINVLSYNINLEITDFTGNSIKGYTRLIIVPKIDNLDMVTLDLLHLNVDSVFLGFGPVINYTYNDTLLHIPLFTPASLSDTLLVNIYYHGVPVVDPTGWGGFYFQSNVAFNLGVGMGDYPHCYGRVWFPCVDDFIERAKYDFYITVTSDKMAVCGGLLQSVVYNTDSTKATYNWRLNNEIPSYLASVAVGKFECVSFSYPGLLDTIPVNIYTRPSDTTNAIHSFTNIISALQIFESRFGPFRWPRAGYVEVPFAGGSMEHATNIAYPQYAVDGSLIYELLYVHELSHNWFGNLVTCRTDEDMWINEGWARFCEFVFKESLYGVQAANDLVQKNHCENLRYLHIEDGDYLPLYGNPHNMTYCSTVYDKGADVVYTLRNYLGDSLFFQGIKSFLQYYAFHDVTTEDLKNYLSTYSGINLDNFFDTWVYSPGFPHFSLDSVITVPDGNNFNVTVYARQRLKGCAQFSSSNILEISFFDSSWNRVSKYMNLSGEFGIASYTLTFNPLFTILDLKDKVSDAITDNTKIIISNGTINFNNTYFLTVVSSLTDSAFIRVEHNWVAPDPLKTPDPSLTLSGSRYWKIDGFIPSSGIFQAKFSYSRATSGSDGYLDNDLINDTITADSLVVLYRESTANDWHVVNSLKEGTSIRGKLVIDTLKLGEYCLAIRNRSLGSYTPQKKNMLKIFPNPSNENVIIELCNSSAGVLKINDINGKEVYSLNLTPGQKTIRWKKGNNPGGTYIVRLVVYNDVLAEEKLVVQ